MSGNMKTLVTFPVEDRYKRIGNEILGEENVIWHPQSGKAEIFLIKNEDFPRIQNPRFIQILTAGTDHIDLRKVPKDAIIASNAGGYSISVAEHCFALLLEHTKKIGKFKDETRQGIYRPEGTTMLYGRTLGIIGYGGIGSRVAMIGKSMGMKIIAIGRGHRDSNADLFISLDDLETLLREADFIVISLPLTKKTYGLIGKEQLDVVKKNCTIVNVGRAEVVRKGDMISFVDRNKEAAYLTDVWWNEPELKDSNRENVVITPHVAGGLSGEVMEMAYRNAFENIKRFIEGEKVHNIVNLEESIYVNREKIGV